MIDEGKVFGRGLAFPPRIGPDGRLAWSAGAQNVRESIQIILMTRLQERLMLPDFGGGLQTFLFEPNIVVTHRLIQESALRALARWEPRIEVDALTVEPDARDPQAAVLSIEYRLIATGLLENLSFTLRFTE